MVDGETVNAAQCRIVPSLLRKGEHPADVRDFVVDRTMSQIGTALGWTREREVKYVRKRIISAYNNTLLKHYALADGMPNRAARGISCRVARTHLCGAPPALSLCF